MGAMAILNGRLPLLYLKWRLRVTGLELIPDTELEDKWIKREKTVPEYVQKTSLEKKRGFLVKTILK